MVVMTTRPTYLELADLLAVELKTAPAGTKVPSEHDLVAAHGVSRITARAALQELELRYLVRRVRGAGTFVRRRIDYVIDKNLPPSFSATVAAAGGAPGSRLLGVVRRAPDRGSTYEQEIADGGDIVEIHRVSLVDGVPANVATMRMSGKQLPDIEEHLDDDVSVHALLQEVYGITLRRWRHQVTLDVPDTTVASLLGDEAPRPCWYAESLNRIEGTTQLGEYASSWAHPQVIRKVFQIEEERQ
ncbi:MAG: UTRA domain-containing protein [Streptosporangiales bacterium]|nr:UTRA domain-containing protein [Streptosporangiales bacterium]